MLLLLRINDVDDFSFSNVHLPEVGVVISFLFRLLMPRSSIHSLKIRMTSHSYNK